VFASGSYLPFLDSATSTDGGLFVQTHAGAGMLYDAVIRKVATTASTSGP